MVSPHVTEVATQASIEPKTELTNSQGETRHAI